LIAPVKNRSVPSILVVLVLGLSAVYLVPFHFPVHDGLSDSYLFGFSNPAATVLLLAFILGFALWTRGLGLHLPDPAGATSDRFWRTGVVAIVCSVFGCALFWLVAQTIDPLLESGYFLDRYAMFSMGGRLFRDFEFDYGPLMFYPPVWIARLCHLSLANGYFLGWIVQWALGTWALWKVVEVAARGTSHGRAIFLLLWAFFLTAIPDSGTNYTPLRFCATLALALAVHSLYAHGASNLATFGLASVGATVLLLYSPEQGIAFTIGTIFFFVVCVRPARLDLFAGLASFVIVVSIVFWLAIRLGVLGNIATVGGGTLDFPHRFSIQSLVLLLLLLVAGCAFIASFRAHTSQGPLLYLICLSVVSAPAAFSRADIGHIIINTLGALIAALVVLSQYRKIWRWTWPVFAIILLLGAYGKFTLIKGTIQNQVHEAVFGTQYYSPEVDKVYTAIYKLTRRNAQARLDQLRTSLARNSDPNAPHLPSQTHLLAPFGVQRRLTPPPDGIEIVTGRYPWLFPMTSTALIQEKIAEIETHQDWPLLLWSRSPQVCVSDPDEERKSLRIFLLAPYLPPPRHTIDAAKPLCDYLNAHYIPSSYASPVPHSFVWVRKGISAP
jgi:hypothetical protein